MPKELVKLIFALISRKQEKIYDALLELPPTILPESCKQILDAIYQIFIQNMGQNLGEVAWIFNIDLKYIFQSYAALELQYDNDQIRELVLKTAQSIGKLHSILKFSYNECEYVT